MRCIKKILIVLLIAIVMIEGMTINIIQDVKAEKFGWFIYEVLNDDTIRITRCNVVFEPGLLYTEDLVIPSQIDGKQVVCIGSYAFADLPRCILNIVIPEGVVTIENNAFENNNFGTVHLPNTVTSIGERAFYNSKELTHINIPTNTTIGKDAFTGCDRLKIEYNLEQTSENSTTLPTTNKTVTKRIFIEKTKVNKITKKFNSKKAVIRLKKVNGAKYQIKISTTNKFEKNKTIIKKVKKEKFTILSKKIQKKKMLYIKVRAYKVINKKHYYSKWSKVKKIIIKK